MHDAPAHEATAALACRFVALCEARSGQLLKLNSLVGDSGINRPTARRWLVKTPKLYFLDSGPLCCLLRIASPEDLSTHAQRGAVVEAWVVGEALKHRYNLGLPADLYFWRDNHGLEVGLVIEHRSRLYAVECKSGMTYSPSWLAPARRRRAIVGDAAAESLLVYGGDEGHRGCDYAALSWQAVAV